MRLRSFISLIFIVLLLVGCRKDEDETPPVITYSGPAGGQSYSAVGTLLFTGTVTDDQNIEWVEIAVKNLNFVNAVSPHIIRPEGVSLNLQQGLVMDDIHLPGGQYYAVITASDGTNESREWREITINEVVRTREGIVVFSQPAADMVDVHVVDEDDNVNFLRTFTGTDFGGGTVNSYDQQVVVMGASEGDVQAVSAVAGFDLWSVPEGLTVGTDYFTGLAFDREDLLTYVGLNDNGEIRGYDKNGTADVQFQMGIGRKAELFTGHNERLLIQTEQVGPLPDQLDVYFPQSGVLDQRVDVIHDTKEMLPFGDHVYLFCNTDQSEGALLRYHLPTNTLTNLNTLPTVPLIDAVEVESGLFLILLADGLYLYDAAADNLVSLVSVTSGSHLAWDAVNDEVWLSVGSTLNVYDLAGSFQRSVSLSAPPVDLQVLYNK